MLKLKVSFVKLLVPAGLANPSPPIGPALGQKGINIMDFCKSFNEKTKLLEKGLLLPVLLTVNSDRSFTYIIKTPSVTVLLKKNLFLKKGSDKPGHNIISTISYKDIQKIADIKKSDMDGQDINSIVKSICGTAKSMGINIKE